MSSYDVDTLRALFPGLAQRVHGRPLVYLDHAATSMTPAPVLDVLGRATAIDRANVHRGVHTLSQRASDAFEAARAEVASFVGAPDPRDGKAVAKKGVDYAAARKHWAYKPVKVTAPFAPPVPMGMVVRKGQKELQQRLTQAVQQMLRDGTFKTISQRWFGYDVSRARSGHAMGG